jgi:hypothetical protein
LDNEKLCDGVVECTALVLAESCAELDGRLTLFGILDELRPGGVRASSSPTKTARSSRSRPSTPCG